MKVYVSPVEPCSCLTVLRVAKLRRTLSPRQPPVPPVTTNSLHWLHNDHDGVSNHQSHGCLLNRLFKRRSKKTLKLRVTGLCVGNSPGPVNSPHKGPVTRKMFPFDDVIMWHHNNSNDQMGSLLCFQKSASSDGLELGLCSGVHPKQTRTLPSPFWPRGSVTGSRTVTETWTRTVPVVKLLTSVRSKHFKKPYL